MQPIHFAFLGCGCNGSAALTCAYWPTKDARCWLSCPGKPFHAPQPCRDLGHYFKIIPSSSLLMHALDADQPSDNAPILHGNMHDWHFYRSRHQLCDVEFCIACRRGLNERSVSHASHPVDIKFLSSHSLGPSSADAFSGMTRSSSVAVAVMYRLLILLLYGSSVAAGT